MYLKDVQGKVRRQFTGRESNLGVEVQAHGVIDEFSEYILGTPEETRTVGIEPGAPLVPVCTGQARTVKYAQDRHGATPISRS